MSVVDDNYTNEYIFAVPTALAQYKPKYIHTFRIYIFIKIYFEQVSNTKLQLYNAYIDFTQEFKKIYTDVRENA